MARRRKKAPTVITREEKILARVRVACGTYPGQNRARTFVDRKKKANKNACRGKSWD